MRSRGSRKSSRASSRAAAGRRSPDPRCSRSTNSSSRRATGPVDVWRVLDSSINLAASEIHHRARLITERGAVPPVLANEARLGQVFVNLLVNAAQAIPEGDVATNEIV